MRRTPHIRWSLMVVGVVALSAGRWAAAQAPATPEPETPAPADEPAAAPDDSEQPQSPATSGNRPARRQQRERAEELQEMIKQLKDLRAAMHEELKLNEGQTGAVNDLFAEHFERARVARDRLAEQTEEDRQAQEQLRTRRREILDEMRAAREAGDRQAMDELQQELRALHRQQGRSPQQELGELVGRLRAQVPRDQLDTFQRILDRLKIGGGQREDMREFYVFMRTLMGTELGLTDRQHEQLRDILRDFRRQQVRSHRGQQTEAATGAATEAAEGKEGGEAAPELNIEDLKRRVNDVLTESQRKQLEEAVQQAAERQEQHRRRGERHYQGQRDTRPGQDD